MTELLTVIVVIANVIMGLVLAALNLRFWLRSTATWRWLKLAYAVVGLGWSGVHIVLLIVSFGPNPWAVPDSCWSAGVTITMGIMAAAAISRWKTL